MVGRCDPPAVTTGHSAKAIKEQRIVNKETSSSNRVIYQDTKMAEVRVLCLNAKENHKVVVEEEGKPDQKYMSLTESL